MHAQAEKQETMIDTGASRLLRRFPEMFSWGVATSAYQIEGAARQDGRGQSIWDVFCRRPGAIADGSNGDVACDHYHRVEADLDLMRSIGVGAYRFSLAWPRVQPLGEGAWNEKGFEFYERLIDGLLRRNIAPHLTLYHWDLPQALQDQGGWARRETAHRFAGYAVEVARRFGARAASIATHNEPWVVAHLGHETGIFAPGVKNRKAAMQASHHLLLSHGLALQSIRAEGIETPLGIVLNQSPIHAATDSPEDLAKARIDDGLLIRWYMDPLLQGRYPGDIWTHLGGDAPSVQEGDLELISQPLDFLGVNYYTRSISTTGDAWRPDENGKEVTDMGWEVHPEGLTELLLRLNRDYVLPAIYITENGAAFRDELIGGRVADPERLDYIRAHIGATADAIAQGVDVRGYFAWSLMDNFEWASGYAKRFGLVYVDYATQRRVLKDSALWYRDFLARANSNAAQSN